MDDTDTELAWILAGCEDTDGLSQRIIKHATIVQDLVCRMGKEVNQSEAGIRMLYAAWADMAVAQHLAPCVVADKVLH